jgi:energy-coupling factor transport system substrate-specific component
MSWQLASFGLVLSSLALAFWWYERSHPPARLLALLATLAALAALGRDALAAIPDVKPTTAIVLVSGVAFGPGPGFAVGAIAALMSNLLLGQGPWTPWQMLGWGLVGLIGGGLGRLTSRRMGALALALACAASAEVFNLVVDAYQWTTVGDPTLRAFGFVLSTSVVFDLTHVLASFAFGLAFGPMLLRMLARVRTRLEVDWQPGAPPAALPTGVTTALLVLAAIVVVAPSSAHASPTAEAARIDVSREVAYLTSAQNSDGGFGAAAGQSSSELYSAWVAIGLAAAGRDPLSVSRDGHTVLDAIRGEASSLQGAGDIERTILALRACGVSVRALAGGKGTSGDLVGRLLRYRAHDGSFGGQGNLTAFAILALRAAGYPIHSTVVRAAAGWLARQQEPDGGFSFAERGGGSDVDDTAAVLQALIAAGQRSDVAIARADQFIVGAQNLDGGFPEQAGGASNAQSTAWAIQALFATSRNVEAITRQGSRSPLGYLESLIAPNGSVRYSRTGAQTPVWVTAQALTALAGKPFPIAPVLSGARSSAAVAATLSPTALARSLGRALDTIGALLSAMLAPALS